jgi:hypothetical protein
VTWRLLTRWHPDLAGQLRVAGRTGATPGLPLITAPDNDASLIASAVAGAIAALADEDRAATGLRGLATIAPAEYMAVPTPAPADRIAQRG